MHSCMWGGEHKQMFTVKRVSLLIFQVGVRFFLLNGCLDMWVLFVCWCFLLW